MAKGQSITVALRKVSSGHRVTAFQMDDMNHAYSIATILLRSPEYSRCFAVALDFQGDQIFHLTPEQVTQAPAPYCVPQQQAPQPQYAPQGYAQPQYAPALPQYAPPPQQPPPFQGYPAQYPQQGYAQPHPTYQAEVVEDFPPPPGFGRLLPPPGRR